MRCRLNREQGARESHRTDLLWPQVCSVSVEMSSYIMKISNAHLYFKMIYFGILSACLKIGAFCPPGWVFFVPLSISRTRSREGCRAAEGAAQAVPAASPGSRHRVQGGAAGKPCSAMFCGSLSSPPPWGLLVRAQRTTARSSQLKGWWCSSVVESVFSTRQVLGSSPTTAKESKENCGRSVLGVQKV